MNPGYEIKNPFVNCEVVCSDYEPSKYQANFYERGSREFVVSRSMLMAFASNPLKWREGWTPKDTESTEWGTLIDCLTLTPLQFPKLFAIQPETYPEAKTNEPKKWNNNATYCREWTTKQKGLQVVTAKELKLAEEAVNKLKSDSRIDEIISHSRHQVLVTGEYSDKATGLVIPVKCLIDIAPDSSHRDYGGSLADLKTARSAHPSTWKKSVFQFGYDAQAALELWLYSAATGETREEFYHVIQENTSPWTIGRRLLSHEFLEIGRLKILNALEAYCRCLKTGVWPSWDDSGDNVINGWGLTQPEAWMATIRDTPEPIEQTEDQPEYAISGGLN